MSKHSHRNCPLKVGGHIEGNCLSGEHFTPTKTVGFSPRPPWTRLARACPRPCPPWTQRRGRNFVRPGRNIGHNLVPVDAAPRPRPRPVYATSDATLSAAYTASAFTSSAVYAALAALTTTSPAVDQASNVTLSPVHASLASTCTNPRGACHHRSSRRRRRPRLGGGGGGGASAAPPPRARRRARRPQAASTWSAARRSARARGPRLAWSAANCSAGGHHPCVRERRFLPFLVSQGLSGFRLRVSC